MFWQAVAIHLAVVTFLSEGCGQRIIILVILKFLQVLSIALQETATFNALQEQITSSVLSSKGVSNQICSEFDIPTLIAATNVVRSHTTLVYSYSVVSVFITVTVIQQLDSPLICKLGCSGIHLQHRDRVVFVGGKPGNFPLTGPDLPSHWFV